MNGLNPNCLDDFLFSNPAERDMLELILSRKLPFPFGGKSGILLHGVWGTGKTTLTELLPCLLETAYSDTWDMAQGAGLMPAENADNVDVKLFRCGGGLASPVITKAINGAHAVYPSWHNSKHAYFVFDEVDKLTAGAQQSLKSVMGLSRSMFIFSTNYLNNVDAGVINRCHLVEMNQLSNVGSYVTLGQKILAGMGLSAARVRQLNAQAVDSYRGTLQTLHYKRFN